MTIFYDCKSTLQGRGTLQKSEGYFLEYGNVFDIEKKNSFCDKKMKSRHVCTLDAFLTL